MDEDHGSVRKPGLFRHRTWRWRIDIEDPDHYEAVETTDRGLRWFAWSHLHGEDGMTDERYQTFEAYRVDGPQKDLPDAIRGQLADWLSTYEHDR